MDKVLDGEDVDLSKRSLNDLVVGKGNALLVDLAVAALVDQLADGLQVGLAVSDVRLDKTKHLLGSLGHLDEDTVVDLEETEKLEDFTGLGCDLVDTERQSAMVPRMGIARTLGYEQQSTPSAQR